jgi:hypothetical protein
LVTATNVGITITNDANVYDVGARANESNDVRIPLTTSTKQELNTKRAINITQFTK